MDSFPLLTMLQVAAGLGLLNVWLVRPNSATPYRGGSARTLREEFSTYRLPTWAFYIVGGLKVAAALALLVGIWMPGIVPASAAVIAVLMLGALAMHAKVSDPFVKSIPALLMLLIAGAILFLV